MKDRYLEAGKIVNTHGIAGEVKILPWADDAQFLLDFDTLYIDGSPWTVSSARVHKGNLLVKLDGIDDVNAAMKLRDKIISIDRTGIELPNGRHFLADLVGLDVRDASTGASLGRVVDVLTPPANEVYVVQGGTTEHLIPAVDEFVLEINLDGGYITVTLIEGM